MNFVSDFKHPEEIKPNSLWFLVYEQKIIVFLENESISIPEYTNLKKNNVVFEHIQYMGTYNNVPCYAAELETTDDLPQCFSVHPPLSLVNEIGEDLVRIAMTCQN